MAWLPQQRVLFAGDLVFNGGTPFVVMGSVAGSLAALERIRQLGADVIVPGHGPVCGIDAIDDQVAYLRFVQEIARRGFDDGTPPLDLALATDLGRVRRRCTIPNGSSATSTAPTPSCAAIRSGSRSTRRRTPT